MSSMSLKIPEELLTRLSTAATRRGMSRSAVVREALETYLGAGGRGNGSAADRARDLIGSLEGPPDLSYNPEHMRGFGG